MLKQIQNSDQILLYRADFFVYHSRRKDLSSFLRQILKYGRGRGQNIRFFRNFQIFHLIPLFCFFIFAALFVLALCGSSVAAVGLEISGLAYLTLNLLASVHLGFQARNSFFILQALFVFPLIHGAYALGMLLGFSVDAKASRYSEPDLVQE